VPVVRCHERALARALSAGALPRLRELHIRGCRAPINGLLSVLATQRPLLETLDLVDSRFDATILESASEQGAWPRLSRLEVSGRHATHTPRRQVNLCITSSRGRAAHMPKRQVSGNHLPGEAMRSLCHALGGTLRGTLKHLALVALDPAKWDELAREALIKVRV
jgi:hypothetical protein